MAVVLLCSAVYALIPVTASGQFLDLEPAAPPRMPTAGLQRRIADVQQQIDQLARVAQKATDADETLALRARMFVRAAAVRMLEQGVAEPYAQSSVTVVKGLTLADGVMAIDTWLTGALQGGAGDHGSAGRERYVAVRAAVERMLEGEAAMHTAPVQALWRTHLTPLLTIADTMDAAPVRSAWLDGSAAPSCDELRDMLVATALSDNQRANWRALIEQIERAEAFIELRPQAERARRRLHEALRLLVTLRELAWLPTDGRDRVASLVDAQLARYRDKSTRGEADRALAQCVALDTRLRSLDLLRRDDDEVVGTLGVVALVGFEQGQRADGVAQGQALDAWLDRIIEALQRHAQHRSLAASREVREAMVAFDGQIATSRRRLVELARTVAAEPTTVHHPSATATARLLSEQVRDRVHLSLLGPSLARITPLGSQPAQAIAQRMRDAVSRMSGSRSGGSEVAAFVEQVGRFIELPGEAMVQAAVARGEPVWQRVLGDRADDWLRAVRSQRAAWAQRWADGATPDDAAAAMQVMHRVMANTFAAAALEAAGAGERLGRWGAWHAEDKVLGAMTVSMTTDLRMLALMVADGRAAQMGDAIAAFEDQHRLTVAATRLLAAVDGSLDGLPVAGTGVLATVLYEPDMHALSARTIEHAALVSWCIVEQQAATAGHDAEAPRALRRVLDEVMATNR